MDTTEVKDIADSLKRISKILASLLLHDLENGRQEEKIKRLKEVGFDNTEIAKMLGTSRNTVNVAVHSLKSKKRTRRSKKNKA